MITEEEALGMQEGRGVQQGVVGGALWGKGALGIAEVQRRLVGVVRSMQGAEWCRECKWELMGHGCRG